MGTVQKEAQSKPGAEAPRGSLDDGGVWRWASGSAPAGADRGGCRERKAEFGGCQVVQGGSINSYSKDFGKFRTDTAIGSYRELWNVD